MIKEHIIDRRISVDSDRRKRVAPRRGRPRTAVPKVVTSVKIPTDLYDAICQQAMRERVSVHSILLHRLATGHQLTRNFGS
jgi:hypothetical protein